MNLIEKGHNFILNRKKKKVLETKNSLLSYLKNLKELEAKLWGIDLIHLSAGEERVLEDANHLIYLVSRNEYSKLKDILNLKDTSNFMKDLEDLRKDFFILKKLRKEII